MYVKRYVNYNAKRSIVIELMFTFTLIGSFGGEILQNAESARGDVRAAVPRIRLLMQRAVFIHCVIRPGKHVYMHVQVSVTDELTCIRSLSVICIIDYC